MLVGDLIVSAREIIPDLPRGLAALGNPVVTVAFAGGSTLPAGTYTAVLTATNPWGETVPSAPVGGLIVGVNQGLQVSAPVVLPPGATGMRVYYALVGQPYTQYAAIPAGGLPFIVSGPGLPGTPPARNTAFYPDADGPTFSAYTLYRWLNEALLMASSIAEGLPDTSGVPAVAQQGQYYIPGYWKKLWHIWFNGFPVAWAGSQDMFYRNKLSGISFLAIVQYNAERLVMELQPQPNQTGGSTTLSAPVAVGDTVLNLTSTAGIILGLGLVQVGSEIIAYSGVGGTGSQLTGCSRGLGGTIESAWPAGTAVNECNIRINGQRLFTNKFTVGQSASSINLPPDWQLPLVDYILNKARQGEQSATDYQAKIKEFTGLIKERCKGNTQVSGPRQVGGSSYPGDSYPTRGGWGVIVP